MLLAYTDTPQRRIAELFSTSPQNINQRIARGTFNISELEQIAAATGTKFVYYFETENGDRI